MSAPLPFTVIGGFLGAGKTTLLNRLLAGANERRFAVLVNDFGALDIDGRLVAEHGGDTVALANGCLCCTIGDSLVTTLLSLLEQPGRFDHIVVEASGVADPGRIADIASVEPRLMRDGVVVVADAEAIRQRAADPRLADTIERQLAAADLLLLNKTDLAADRTALREWLAVRSRAPILEAVRGDVPLPLLFGLERQGVPADIGRDAPFRSWSYRWADPVDRAGLLAMLEDAPDILRGKGIVRFADSCDRRSVLHMVGRRIEISEDGPWERDAESQLVLLGPRAVLSSL